MATLTPVQSITVSGTINGPAIINDLCNRIADKLERSNELRPVDAYRSYAARVTIDLQLVDIDTNSIATEVSVGNIDPGQKTQSITLSGTAMAEADRSLERPVVPEQGEVITSHGRSYLRQRDPVSGQFLK